jgi:hypothetical protein
VRDQVLHPYKTGRIVVLYISQTWIGHTLRKEDEEIPKAALLLNPQESWKRGRPKINWRRSVIKEAGRSWNELRFLAADRSGKNS